MSLIKQATESKGVRWTVLVALLVSLTQFDKGLELFYRKWNADAQAEEAKTIAVEAKATAEGVDDRFDRYIEQQQQAIETQNKVAEAIADYAKQNQQMQQQVYVAPPQVPCEWDEVGEDYWQCDIPDRQLCFDERLWYRVERCP